MNKQASQKKWRLGVVSFLNARPLIAGLESDSRFELIFDVPARLANRLDAGEFDVALVPVIDLVARDRDWQIISDACIGCDGETLTVRVFSRIRPEEIRTLHVDGDSHTSVALARIIWKEQYGQNLNVIPYAGTESLEECEAILLIGDKVVTGSMIDYEIETDLGSAWKSLTSLPFVFAAWAGCRGLDTSELANRLAQARDHGVASADMIAEDFAPAQGWPVTLAKRYFSSRLKFDLGERQRKGMTRFLELAKRQDLVAGDRKLVFA